MVTWPSRDVVAAARLPRPRPRAAGRARRAPARPAAAPRPPRTPHLRVRRARDGRPRRRASRLAMHEIAYSSLVGGSVLRPDAEAVKRTALRERWRRDEPIVGRRARRTDGRACSSAASPTPSPGSWLAGPAARRTLGLRQLRLGAARSARGSGVGHALVAAALPGAPAARVARHLPLLQPAEPDLLGVLAPPRLPAALDALGGPARDRVALIPRRARTPSDAPGQRVLHQRDQHVRARRVVAGVDVHIGQRAGTARASRTTSTSTPSVPGNALRATTNGRPRFSK